jgi:hypothetical protein
MVLFVIRYTQWHFGDSREFIAPQLTSGQYSWTSNIHFVLSSNIVFGLRCVVQRRVL